MDYSSLVTITNLAYIFFKVILEILGNGEKRRITFNLIISPELWIAFLEAGVRLADV